MQIWPPQERFNKNLEHRDAEFQFKITWGMLPGKIMRKGFITIIEDEAMARDTEGKRIGDRLYVKCLYNHLLSTKGLDALDWCFELAMVRVLIKINQNENRNVRSQRLR